GYSHSSPTRRSSDLDKIRSFGGSVEELDATGLVAVFGVEPVEDATVRAGHTARAILNGVEHLRRTGQANLTVKVAIHVDEFLFVDRKSTRLNSSHQI